MSSLTEFTISVLLRAVDTCQITVIYMNCTINDVCLLCMPSILSLVGPRDRILYHLKFLLLVYLRHLNYVDETISSLMLMLLMATIVKS